MKKLFIVALLFAAGCTQRYYYMVPGAITEECERRCTKNGGVEEAVLNSLICTPLPSNMGEGMQCESSSLGCYCNNKATFYLDPKDLNE